MISSSLFHPFSAPEISVGWMWDLYLFWLCIFLCFLLLYWDKTNSSGFLSNLFLEQSWLTANWGHGKEISHMPLLPMRVKLSSYQYLPPERHIVANEAPTLTCQNHPNSVLDSTIHSWCCTVCGFGYYLMMCCIIMVSYTVFIAQAKSVFCLFIPLTFI